MLIRAAMFELILTSQCDNALENFRIKTYLPTGYAIDRIVILGQERPQVLNLIDLDWKHHVLPFLGQLFPDISFVAACEWLKKMSPKLSLTQHQQTELMQVWGFRWDEITIQTAQRVLSFEEHFLNWLHLKKVSPQELQVLNITDQISENLFNDFNSILSYITSQPCSRQQGIQILELSLELLALEKPVLSILNLEDSLNGILPAALIKKLQTIRYPTTTSKDASRENILNTKRWPQNTEARWLRQGDRSGLELKIFITGVNARDKYENTLLHLQKFLDEQTQDLWPT